MVANIIALGAISELTSIVSKKAIEAAVLDRVPKGTEKLNRDALKAGMAAARRVKKGVPATETGKWENEDL
jgi:2-oxoglutarate ferredoxin oxidoreductase subunit gamma